MLLNLHVISCFHRSYAEHILELAYLCLALGYFPPSFKEQKIVPIPKSSNADIRFLGVSTGLCQIISKFYGANLNLYVDKYGLLPKDQHGFRANYSTTTALGTIFHRLNVMPKTETPIFMSFFFMIPNPNLEMVTM